MGGLQAANKLYLKSKPTQENNISRQIADLAQNFIQHCFIHVLAMDAIMAFSDNISQNAGCCHARITMRLCVCDQAGL